MKRSKVAQWFEANPDALKAVRRWRNRDGDDWTKCVYVLRERFGFPFNSPTTLARYMKGEIGKAEKPVAKPRQKTEPIPTFTRTKADLRKLGKAKVYFVTSAVSNVLADDDFLKAVQVWKEHTGGAVLVNPVLYVNPTRRHHEQEGDSRVWWDDRLRDWMLDQELRPHPKLSIMTTKAQATANNPLPPRAEALTKDRSAVFGHPQLAMKTIASPQDKRAKMLYSSGAITRPEYSDTITGDVAKFHHVLGGVIVEVAADRFHLREVNWNGEEFVDIDTSYTPTGAWHAEPANALVLGDVHVGRQDNHVLNGSIYGDDSLLAATSAKRVILHDLFDGRSINHHEIDNVLKRAAEWTSGKTNLRRELEATVAFLDLVDEAPELIVVASNHDDFLTRWLAKGERGVEPENRALYHHLSAAMLDHHEKHGHFPNALEIALERVGYDGRANFLEVDESLRIGGVELGMHGHLGPNGARGSIRNLSRIGTRSIIGHSHSPGIWQGVYQVGHSSHNRHGYNRGPSSWSTTHALLHANGRRQLIHMIGDRFRL